MLVTQLCLTLCDPMDCSPPGSSVHGIFQARILEWVAIFFSNYLPKPVPKLGSGEGIFLRGISSNKKKKFFF